MAIVTAQLTTNRQTLGSPETDTVRLASSPRWVEVINVEGTADLTVLWESLDPGDSVGVADPTDGAVDNWAVPPGGTLVLGPFFNDGDSVVKVLGSGNTYIAQAVSVE